MVPYLHPLTQIEIAQKAKIHDGPNKCLVGLYRQLSNGLFKFIVWNVVSNGFLYVESISGNMSMLCVILVVYVKVKVVVFGNIPKLD